MKKQSNPVTISKDVWFYVNKKSIDFVVWCEINGKRKAVQFRLLENKLKKYL